MKTTVDIADALLEEARRAARRQGTSVRALIEDGLRQVLKRQARTGFKLRRASFRGQGLHTDAAGGSWETLRARIYEGRGE